MDIKLEKTCIKKPADSSNQCIPNDLTFKYLLKVLISKVSVMGNSTWEVMEGGES